MSTIAATNSTTRSLSSYALISLLLTLGSSSTFLAPVEIDGVAAQFGLSGTGAGGVVTGELIFSAIAALGLVNVLPKINVTRLSLIAALGVCFAQALSCLHLSLTLMVIARLVAGLGCGALYAIACYLASQQAQGVRMLGVGFIVASAMTGIAMIFFPVAVEHHGLRGMFGPLAVFGILTLVAVAAIGNLPRCAPPISAEIRVHGGARRDLLILLAVCGFGNGGLQMLWTFSEGAASARGFTIDSISVILSVSTLFNIAGSLVAGLLDRKRGMSKPLVFGMLGGAGAGVIMAASSGLSGYAAGLFLYGFACFFVLPYALAAGAAIDNTGRAATLGGATVFVAGAISPLIGGYIQDWVSLTAVAWCAGIGCLIAAVCAFTIRKPLDT